MACVIPQGWDFELLVGVKILAWVFVRAPHRLRVQANWLLLLPLDVGFVFAPHWMWALCLLPIGCRLCVCSPLDVGFVFAP